MNFDPLGQKILGNTLENYLWFAGIVLAGLVFKNLISRAVSYLLFNLLKKHFKTIGVQKLVDLVNRPFSITIFLLFVYTGCSHLHFPDEWHLASEKEFGVRMTLMRIFQMTLVVFITWTITRIIDYAGLVLKQRSLQTDSKMDDLFIPFMTSAVKALIVIFGFLVILGNVLDLNVTSIVAGLGIGGLAFALASKDTLENLLGSFLIFLDRPFVVGDLVRVGLLRGHVEEVGFRSTKIRTLEKTLIIVPNKKMMDAELENQTERTFYRHKFVIGLVYSTSSAQIKKIITDLLTALSEHNLVREGASVNFVSFGASSLDLDVTYFVMSRDADVFEKVKEEINFKIMDIVSANGSAFAFPSTTVYLERER